MFTSPQFSKGGVELAGQNCDVTVARDHSEGDNANPSGVQIKTNVDKVGDVIITAIQKGEAKPEDFDAHLPTIHVTQQGTTILEAGRRSLDKDGMPMLIKYDSKRSVHPSDIEPAYKAAV